MRFRGALDVDELRARRNTEIAKGSVFRARGGRADARLSFFYMSIS